MLVRTLQIGLNFLPSLVRVGIVLAWTGPGQESGPPGQGGENGHSHQVGSALWNGHVPYPCQVGESGLYHAGAE